MFICSPLLSLTLEHDIHHQKLSEKPSPSAQHSLLHTPNPSSSPPANHLFKTLKQIFEKQLLVLCVCLYVCIKVRGSEREREYLPILFQDQELHHWISFCSLNYFHKRHRPFWTYPFSLDPKQLQKIFTIQTSPLISLDINIYYKWL